GVATSWDWFFGGTSSQTQVSSGSGVIFTTDGYIVTNNHVVASAERIEIIYNKRNYAAELVGTDPSTDLAVLKIEESNLPAIKLGNAKNVQVGEWVIAVGNPFSLSSTVTAGIVSAKGRRIGILEDKFPIESFIQTDAAINPGNSGGPLLNASGQVIGMNTAIIQGAQGLGFAIPIKTAQQIAKELISTGKAEHAYLGIEMATLTPDVKNQINNNPNSSVRVAVDRGVAIVSVVPNSPAAAAGLRPGDAIQKINNRPIIHSEAVQELVQNAKVGGNLQMEINRNGQIVILNVRPGSLPVQKVS
ncbi:MAG: PDZ domain-containing protein, partial [Oscillatoriales cyanobacterium RU_3_3]|nr:PDZ domain-containing protein [Oscillatoriales cyanobacterium RU_3_3]